MELRPKFRKDLIVSEQTESDGSQTVILKDPVSEKFYRLALFEYQFLRTFDGTRTQEEALERFRSAGYYCSPEEGKLILAKAGQLGLMLATRFGSAQFQRYLRDRHEEAKRARFLSSLYFLYIPVVNPDAFLERTLWLFRSIANKWTGLAMAILAPGALYFVVSQLPDMAREYTFFFNWENLLYLWITIALIKLVHELAHAYTAKRFGLHVPQMGVAFLIFFPCLYCNTTDAWQLADRKQRMTISLAGILAEGAVAIIATYAWYFTGPSVLNSLAFYLMAASFVSTVVFNGNPLMKFDGYFVFIDYFEVPNLQGKSLGYLRYLFLNRVLGMSTVPNTASRPRESALFLGYGVSAFIYRVFLYTGIVTGVYFRFDKTLGAILALLAFALFIARPVSRGLAGLYTRRSEIRPHLDGIAVFVLVIVLIVGPLLIPWSSKSVYPCFVASARVQKLTIPLQTSVSKVFVRPGSIVTAGTVLFALDDSQLRLALLKKEMERDIAQKELEILRLDAKDRGKAPSKQLEVFRAEDAIKTIQEQLKKALTDNVAPFDGAITTLDYRLQPGYQPGEGAIVGEVQSVDECVVQALVPGTDRHKAHVGQNVEIWFPVGTGLTLNKKIDHVKRYSERDLRDSPFSSRVGGELPTEVRGDHVKDAPLDAQYTCSVHVDNGDRTLLLGMTGRCAVASPPLSLLSRLVETFLKALSRESLVQELRSCATG